MTTIQLVIDHAKRYHHAATSNEDGRLALQPRILEREFANASFVHPDFREHKRTWLAVAKNGALAAPISEGAA